ncbi:unnamed protein product [Knipowitschia caucasica]
MYDLLELMGEGVYAEVYKALNKRTGEIVALKQVKNMKRASYFWLRELKMMSTIGDLDADSSNCIRLNNCFRSADGDHFMEFEMLDQNVLQFMEKRDAPFSLKELRPMAKGLLVALESLRSVGVIHTDIKLDNIMFVDQEAKPFKVKLIDFGVAKFKKEMHIGDSIQPIAYRAPEVTLGLPLSEAVDMWGLGCCLLECFLKCLPFNVASPYDHLQQITKLLGVPDAGLITRAKEGTGFFVQEKSGEWRLKSIFEYRDSKGNVPEMEKNTLEFASDLEDVILNTFEFSSGIEHEDRKVFLDLLKKMLEVDPDKRITPAEALLHPFITMSHFLPALANVENSEQLLDYKPKSSGTSDSSDDEASGKENESVQASESECEEHDIHSKPCEIFPVPVASHGSFLPSETISSTESQEEDSGIQSPGHDKFVMENSIEEESRLSDSLSFPTCEIAKDGNGQSSSETSNESPEKDSEAESPPIIGPTKILEATISQDETEQPKKSPLPLNEGTIKNIQLCNNASFKTLQLVESEKSSVKIMTTEPQRLVTHPPGDDIVIIDCDEQEETPFCFPLRRSLFRPLLKSLQSVFRRWRSAK